MIALLAICFALCADAQSGPLLPRRTLARVAARTRAPVAGPRVLPTRGVATSALSSSVAANATGPLQSAFESAGLVYGGPLFLRSFKYGDAKFNDFLSVLQGARGPQQQASARARRLNGQWYTNSTLEIWATRADGNGLALFRAYPVCAFSGKMGPKNFEGDLQTPEGFYTVVPSAFNPRSTYRLSFNVGYPNRYDSLKRRTGGLVMVHGDCVSVGCLAMNEFIDEVYTIVSTSAMRGQSAIPMHMLPFPLTDDNVAQAVAEWPEHEQFWTRELLPAYQAFEGAETKRVPVVEVDTSSGTPVYRLRA